MVISLKIQQSQLVRPLLLLPFYQSEKSIFWEWIFGSSLHDSLEAEPEFQYSSILSTHVLFLYLANSSKAWQAGIIFFPRSRGSTKGNSFFKQSSSAYCELVCCLHFPTSPIFLLSGVFPLVIIFLLSSCPPAKPVS